MKEITHTSLKILYAFLALIVAESHKGQGKPREAFIPKQWEIRDSIRFNFNTDQLSDFVMVVADIHGKKSFSGHCPQKEYYPEKLIILSGTGNNLYTLSASTEILFSNNCKSDYYFYSLEKRKTSLKVNFSTEAPNQLTKDVFLYFQFTTDNWFLIGATTKYHTSDYKGGYWGEDYNLKTGKKEFYKIQVERNEFEIIEKKRLVTKTVSFEPRPLLALHKADIYAISEEYLPELK